jgi:hypothetical protein
LATVYIITVSWKHKGSQIYLVEATNLRAALVVLGRDVNFESPDVVEIQVKYVLENNRYMADR